MEINNKIRSEFNEIQTRTFKESMKQKSSIFKNISKIDKPLNNLTRRKISK
jgi:hypothetical protein